MSNTESKHGEDADVADKIKVVVQALNGKTVLLNELPSAKVADVKSRAQIAARQREKARLCWLADDQELLKDSESLQESGVTAAKGGEPNLFMVRKRLWVKHGSNKENVATEACSNVEEFRARLVAAGRDLTALDLVGAKPGELQLWYHDQDPDSDPSLEVDQHLYELAVGAGTRDAPLVVRRTDVTRTRRETTGPGDSTPGERESKADSSEAGAVDETGRRLEGAAHKLLDEVNHAGTSGTPTCTIKLSEDVTLRLFKASPRGYDNHSARAVTVKAGTYTINTFMQACSSAECIVRRLWLVDGPRRDSYVSAKTLGSLLSHLEGSQERNTTPSLVWFDRPSSPATSPELSADGLAKLAHQFAREISAHPGVQAPKSSDGPLVQGAMESCEPIPRVSAAKAVQEHIAGQYDLRKIGKDQDKDRKLALVVGRSGIGKTTMCSHMLAWIENEPLDSATGATLAQTFPVRHSVILQHCDVVSEAVMCSMILRRILESSTTAQVKVPTNLSATDLVAIIDEMMEHQNTLVLVCFDEAQAVESSELTKLATALMAASRVAGQHIWLLPIVTGTDESKLFAHATMVSGSRKDVIRLEPFSNAEVATLARGLTGLPSLSEPIEQFLTLAGGVPRLVVLLLACVSHTYHDDVDNEEEAEVAARDGDRCSRSFAAWPFRVEAVRKRLKKCDDVAFAASYLPLVTRRALKFVFPCVGFETPNLSSVVVDHLVSLTMSGVPVSTTTRVGNADDNITIGDAEKAGLICLVRSARSSTRHLKVVDIPPLVLQRLVDDNRLRETPSLRTTPLRGLTPENNELENIAFLLFTLHARRSLAEANDLSMEMRLGEVLPPVCVPADAANVLIFLPTLKELATAFSRLRSDKDFVPNGGEAFTGSNKFKAGLCRERSKYADSYIVFVLADPSSVPKSLRTYVRNLKGKKVGVVLNPTEFECFAFLVQSKRLVRTTLHLAGSTAEVHKVRTTSQFIPWAMSIVSGQRDAVEIPEGFAAQVSGVCARQFPEYCGPVSLAFWKREMYFAALMGNATKACSDIAGVLFPGDKDAADVEDGHGDGHGAGHGAGAPAAPSR